MLSCACVCFLLLVRAAVYSLILVFARLFFYALALFVRACFCSRMLAFARDDDDDRGGDDGDDGIASACLSLLAFARACSLCLFVLSASCVCSPVLAFASAYVCVCARLCLRVLAFARACLLPLVRPLLLVSRALARALSVCFVCSCADRWLLRSSPGAFGTGFCLTIETYRSQQQQQY